MRIRDDGAHSPGQRRRIGPTVPVRLPFLSGELPLAVDAHLRRQPVHGVPGVLDHLAGGGIGDWQPVRLVQEQLDQAVGGVQVFRGIDVPEGVIWDRKGSRAHGHEKLSPLVDLNFYRLSRSSRPIYLTYPPSRKWFPLKNSRPSHLGSGPHPLQRV